MNATRLLIPVSLACFLVPVSLAGTRTTSHGDVSIAMTACSREPWCTPAVGLRTPADRHAVRFSLGEGGPQGVDARHLEILDTNAFSVSRAAIQEFGLGCERALVSWTLGTEPELQLESTNDG
jgi:hypothetical protein